MFAGFPVSSSQRFQTYLLLFLVVFPSVSNAGNLEAMFSTREHHFGLVQRGAEVEHQFVLTNTSERELVIRQVRVSCHCVEASASQQQIPPGSSATIHAKMKTSGSQGSKSVNVFVDFERPWFSQVTLRVSAEITNDAPVHQVDFGTLTAGSESSKRLVLRLPATEQSVNAIHSDSPFITAKAEKMEPDGNGVRYLLTFQLHKTAPAGSIDEALLVKTNHPVQPDVLIRARANIQNQLTVLPSPLRWTDRPVGEKTRKMILIKGDQPFKIVRVENTRGLFEVFATKDSLATQKMMLQLQENADPQNLPDHLTIVTDLNGETNVRLNLEW